MIRQFVASLEDPNLPLLSPNYWILRKIGLILPEYLLGKIAYILLHQYAVIFVLSQYVELYVIKSDLDEVITNLKISMLSVVCVLKANTCMFWQKSWRELIDYVTEEDKYERETQNEVRGKIIDSYTKYCRIITYAYWCLVFTTLFSVFSTPLILYYSSSNLRDEIRNGTEMLPHIFSSWMPFDKNHFPGSVLTILSHIFIGFYGTINMCAYDTNIIVIMVFFGGKFDLLRERCKEMLGSGGVGVSEQQALKAFRQLHSSHVKMTQYIRLFNSLLSPVMCFYMVVDTLMLCASAYQLTAATDTFQTFLMAEFLIFGVAQLFMFCWHSDDVSLKSEDVRNGLYESQWWAASVPQRKSILLLGGQFHLPNQFTAGPFTKLTLPTFLSILKGSYSYYTLLRK